MSYPLINVIISWYLYLFGVTFLVYILFVALGVKGFKELTTYVEKKTLLHRINPLTKIIILLLVTIVASQSIWWIGATLGVIAFSLFIPLKRVKVVSLFTFMQVFGMTWGFAIYTSPSLIQQLFGNKLTTIWVFPSYFIYFGVVPDLTLQALIYGFQVAMRVWSMFLFSILILMTTTTSEVIRALSKFKVPLSITFAITIAMISIPRIFEIADTAYKIQVMRGENKFIAFFQSIIPTTIFLFKSAKITGISAETRCFMAKKERTELYDMPLTSVDKVIITTGILLTAIDLYLVAIGLIPAIPFH
ncbi:energy-coupling factor transporter transmembrane component T [Sulfurisphaera javensis]|uniref:Energy-coupling factor transporter transmembrane component T n=1 Tax=Sulfurisphaera javensis TaxID=2049879 RepID=A0AAT9GSZ2_9CREN